MNIYLQYFHDICIKVFTVLLTFIYKFPTIWYYFMWYDYHGLKENPLFRTLCRRWFEKRLLFKINESRDNLCRECWHWEINFITFALESHHYPRLYHQPITAWRTVYIIIVEVAISRSSLRRSIIVNPAATGNNKSGSNVSGAMVLVITASVWKGRTFVACSWPHVWTHAK